MFDSLSTKEFLNSRQRSNPYETIKGAIFQNRYQLLSPLFPPSTASECGLFSSRAAMKMANMDAVTGFMFTDPKKENGVRKTTKQWVMVQSIPSFRLPWVLLMCCILPTSVLALEGSQSTSCGGRSGTQRDLDLPSKVPLSPSLSLPPFLHPVLSLSPYRP